MSSCSSATSVSQPSIKQLLQKATSPTPQQADDQTLKNARNAADKPPQQDALNTEGPRGTSVNIST